MSQMAAASEIETKTDLVTATASEIASALTEEAEEGSETETGTGSTAITGEFHGAFLMQ